MMPSSRTWLAQPATLDAAFVRGARPSWNIDWSQPQMHPSIAAVLTVFGTVRACVVRASVLLDVGFSPALGNSFLVLCAQRALL